MSGAAGLDDTAVVEVAEAFLAIRRVGLSFTEVIESQIGSDYRSNSAVLCLAIICERGPIRLRDLSPGVALSGPATSRVVDRLVATGDVVRQPGIDPSDRRAVTMAATRAGQRRLQRIDAALVDAAVEIGTPLKETIIHLDQLPPEAPNAPSGDESAPTPGIRSLVGRLAHFGTVSSTALRAAVPSDDVTEALALFVLAESGTSRPRTISDRVGLTTGGTTKLLDRLEDAGLIERRFGLRHDRRGVSIELTAAGRHRLTEAAELAAPLLVDARPSLVEVNNRLDRR